MAGLECRLCGLDVPARSARQPSTLNAGDSPNVTVYAFPTVLYPGGYTGQVRIHICGDRSERAGAVVGRPGVRHDQLTTGQSVSGETLWRGDVANGIEAHVAHAIHRIKPQQFDLRRQVAGLGRLGAQQIGAEVLLVAVAEDRDDDGVGAELLL